MTIKQIGLTLLVFSSFIVDAKSKIENSYRLKFSPAFHLGLELHLNLYTDNSSEMILSQGGRAKVREVVEYNGGLVFKETVGASIQELEEVLKPNFLIKKNISPTQTSTFLSLFQVLDSCSVRDSITERRLDGISIEYNHFNGKKEFNGSWRMPLKDSGVYHALIKILDVLETDSNFIVVKTVHNIQRYFKGDDSELKVVNDDPLVIRIISSPCCPCAEQIEKYVKALPDAETIYLDVRNYSDKDTECFYNAFKEKYKYLRWIIEPEDDGAPTSYERLYGKD